MLVPCLLEHPAGELHEDAISNIYDGIAFFQVLLRMQPNTKSTSSLRFIYQVWFVGMILLASCIAASAQDSIRKYPWWRLDKLANKNLKFIPIPTISASPETGVRFGLSLDYFYRTSRDSDTSIRASLSWIQVLYSTRRQFTLEGFTSTYTPNEKYYLFFRGGFISNYERYWGRSFPNAKEDGYDEVTYQRFFANSRTTKNLGKRIFAGLEWYYSDYRRITLDSLSSIAAGAASNVASLAPSRIGGIGWDFNIDRRDNQFSPTRGMYLDVSNSYFFDLRSGRYAYRSLSVDARKYWEWKRHVLAGQVLLSNLSGDVPDLELLRFGGGNVMRGFFQGRFRDKNLWALQQEYRYELTEVLRLALFQSIGSTAPRLGDMFSGQVHWSGGVGGRFLFNKQKKVFIRADVAITDRGNLGYYFRIGDAF